MEGRLAQHPRHARALARRVLAEQPVPPVARTLDAGGVLVDRAERRIPERLQEVVRIGLGRPRDAHRADRLLAVVACLGQRPDAHPARALDVVDQVLIGRAAGVRPRGVNRVGERPCTHDGGHDDRASQLPAPRARPRQQQHAGDDEHRRQRVERRLQPSDPGPRVADDRQCLERAPVETPYEQVLLGVVQRQRERERRARPEVVRHHLDAGHDQHARPRGARLRDAREVLVQAVAHRARLVRHARERAKRRQAVLHAIEIVLGQQYGAEPLPLGHVRQLLEREIAGGEIGVHVDHRGDPLVRLRRVRRRSDQQPAERDEPRKT